MEERSSLRRDSVKIHKGWGIAGDKGWRKEILEVVSLLYQESTNKITGIKVLRLFPDHP